MLKITYIWSIELQDQRWKNQLKVVEGGQWKQGHLAKAPNFDPILTILFLLINHLQPLWADFSNVGLVILLTKYKQFKAIWKVELQCKYFNLIMLHTGVKCDKICYFVFNSSYIRATFDTLRENCAYYNIYKYSKASYVLNVMKPYNANMTTQFILEAPWDLSLYIW